MRASRSRWATKTWPRGFAESPHSPRADRAAAVASRRQRTLATSARPDDRVAVAAALDHEGQLLRCLGHGDGQLAAAGYVQRAIVTVEREHHRHGDRDVLCGAERALVHHDDLLVRAQPARMVCLDDGPQHTVDPPAGYIARPREMKREPIENIARQRL